jgi:hypothetical protein
MLRELAKRSGDGLVVRLFWDSERNEVILTFRDRRTGDRFGVEVPKACALQAFEHPAAFRPLESQAA